MRSERIHYVFSVVEAGSLRGAALQLGLAVSTVSQGIRALERELGTSLFVRDQGMKLTPRGGFLLPHLHRLLEAENDLLHAVRSLVGSVPTSLGTHFGYGANFVDQLDRCPVLANGKRVAVRYMAGDWRDLSNGLASGLSDLAIVIGPLSIDPSLAWEVLHRESVVAAVSKDCPVESIETTTLAELDSIGWAPIQRGLLDDVWLDRLTGVDERGGPPPWTDTPASSSPFELAAAVHAGQGVQTTIRPLADFVTHHGDFILEVCDIPPLAVRLAWRKGECDPCRDAVIAVILECGLAPTLGE